MSKRKKLEKENGRESFGKRLAHIRQLAGYSQRALASEIGVSQRVIAYYETETKYPPAHLLPELARVLRVTTDELLGKKAIKEKKNAPDSRLWRRFKQIEKLPPPEQRDVSRLLDVFIEKQRLKQAQT